MKVGLFLGSFNPIHVGHLAIANFMSEKTDLDQVWLIVSPRNPLKKNRVLADGKKRLAQVRKAIGKSAKIKVSNIEFKLSQPSYTVNTLKLLKKKFPKNEFVLIMGSDNLNLLHKWKDYKNILNQYQIYVYPRADSDKKRSRKYPNILWIDAPLLNVSSTRIRELMKKGKEVRRFLP